MTTKPTALPEPFGYTSTHPKWDSRDFEKELFEVNSEYGWNLEKLYTQHQLIDYGRAEYLRGLSEAAELCANDYATDSEAAYGHECSEAIRALALKEQQT